jgi:hypothetical protein
MKVELKNVEKELAKLWDAETSRTRSARVELFTLVALVSEPRLLERANNVLAKVARMHECRTIAALWKDGAAAPRAIGCQATSIDCSCRICQRQSGGLETCPMRTICSIGWCGAPTSCS